MKDTAFYRLLLMVVCLCVAATIAHFAYAVYAYQHCSIIEFIAREPW